jgi:hypothetical protein
MHVRSRAFDAMQIHALGLQTALLHKIMDERFELRREQQVAAFSVPIDVEINLMEDMTRHRFRPLQQEAG